MAGHNRLLPLITPSLSLCLLLPSQEGQIVYRDQLFEEECKDGKAQVVCGGVWWVVAAPPDMKHDNDQ